MTDKEKVALDELKRNIAELQDNCFRAMRHCSKLTERELKNTGHKSVEAAIVYTFKYYDERISKLYATFFKAFPDK